MLGRDLATGIKAGRTEPEGSEVALPSRSSGFGCDRIGAREGAMIVFEGQTRHVPVKDRARPQRKQVAGMKKILLADDHTLVREMIAEFLFSKAGFRVEQAGSLHDALKLNAERGPFNLILLDYTMPGMDALSGLTRMCALSGCPVAILSGTAPPDIARRALRAGAAGFLPKTLDTQDFVVAIHRMLAGETYLPTNFSGETPSVTAAISLTPREQDVLRRVAEGKLNKEIARDLDIQEVTVKLHVKTLSRKLGASNRTHAAMLGRDMGLV